MIRPSRELLRMCRDFAIVGRPVDELERIVVSVGATDSASLDDRQLAEVTHRYRAARCWAMRQAELSEGSL